MRTIEFVYPQNTKAVSLSGPGCALNCKHCNKHYLEGMDTLESPVPEGTKSFLLSGGLNVKGESFILDRKEELLKIKEEGNFHFNAHVGFVSEEDVESLSEVVDYVSFDFVSDSAVIKKVYKLDKDVDEYIDLYKRLSEKMKVFPHITIGLDAGKIHWEYEAIDIISDLGADRLVLNVLIPTAGTEFEDVPNPDLKEVRKVMEYAREKFAGKKLIVGCMRPTGKYRSDFDEMAVEIGVDRIVQPTRRAREKAEKEGLEISYLYECCAMDTKQYDKRHPGHGKIQLEVPRGKCCSEQAPENKMRLSLNSAILLGLKKSRIQPKTKTLYLMNSGGCVYSCSFCPQGRGITDSPDKLSRISWPEFEMGEVLEAMRQHPESFKRVCMQVVNAKGAVESLPETVSAIRAAAPDAKIAMTVRTYEMKDVDEIFAAGADEVGLCIDAVDPDKFKEIKGGDFEMHKEFVLEAADKYPNKIATHLIAGIGETEKQMVEMMQELHDHKVIIALFAFTPVKGTDMENTDPPDMSSYRRIQIALHLIRNDRNPKFKYGKYGEVVDFGLGKAKLFDLLLGSNVFETSGCSDCNRPYYNERAGAKDLYNHPERIEEGKFRQVFESVIS